MRELASGRKGSAHVEADANAASIFNQALVEITRLLAGQALRAQDFSGARHLIGVGGDYREFLRMVLAANRQMQGILLDLPHAVAGARTYLADDAVAGRVQFTVGKFLETVSAGGDIYLLKNILNNSEDEHSITILGNGCEAMSAMHNSV